MPSYNKRMQDGMDLLHVNHKDSGAKPDRGSKKVEEILEELKEWCADGNIFDIDVLE